MKTVLFSLFALVLCGCAANSPLQGPPPAGPEASSYALGHSAQVETETCRWKFLDDGKSIVYSQDFGGLEFLPGILSTLINTPFIAYNTRHEAGQLRGRLDLKPREIFREVARNEKFELGTDESAADTRITPYLQVLKVGADELVLAAALQVEREPAGGRWRGRYFYQLPGRYSPESLAGLDLLGMYKIYGAAVEGYARLLRRLAAEGGEAAEPEQDISFVSEVVAPRRQDAMPGRLVAEDDGMVWVRAAGGVYAVHKSAISYSKPAGS